MIDMDDFMPIIIGFIAAGLLFFAFLIFVKKTIRTPSTDHITTDHDKKLMKQQWRMDDVRSRQRSLMREQRRKIRDLQRR